MDTSKHRSITAREWCGIDGSTLAAFVSHIRNARHDHGGIILREDVRRAFRQFVQACPRDERGSLRRTLGGRIAQTEEVIFHDTRTCIVLREEPGERRAYVPSPDGERLEVLDERRFLSLRESLVLGRPTPERFAFGVDFRPFRIMPVETGSAADIGDGPRRVAALLEREFRGDFKTAAGRLLGFLAGRSVDGQPILFERFPDDIPDLRVNLQRALSLLDSRPAREESARVMADLKMLGFAPGWGRTVGRARETLAMLETLLLDPDRSVFIRLFQRLPLMRRILLVTVHGWFAQANVFGRPDTGGQVVYVLDQARALDSYLRVLWRDAGLDVKPHILILTRRIPNADHSTCDRPTEKVKGTEHAWILRTPFRNAAGDEEPNWISRFQIWPYLKRYAEEAFEAVTFEFGGEAPDLIVGNYSDGNLVASILGREWRAPIAVIAHALEKNKYLLSDLYWRDLESDYHFSIHFLSDILAANSADFIIASTYQEIAGTRTELGQYESYEVFTLPERYRVYSGVDVHSARFVINPPGVNTTVYHPWSVAKRGGEQTEREIEGHVFGDPKSVPGTRGMFASPDKPIIFSMARMDRIKNLAGLVLAYAKRPALRDAANLLLLSGVTNVNESQDMEEREQIQRLDQAYAKYALDDSVRWLPGRLGQSLVPHYYRFVARRGGVFVQPALFEAFGLTVLESMACGLPVVVTRYGGPASIIEDGVSGFLFDPGRPPELERAVLDLLNGRTNTGSSLWEAVSHAGIRRVHEHFSWKAHGRRLSGAYGLYSFWNHLYPRRRELLRGYVNALHHLLLDRLIEESWPGH